MLDITEIFTPISDRCAHQRNVYHLQTLQLQKAQQENTMRDIPGIVTSAEQSLTPHRA